jgi:hypothetical protein
MSKIILGLSAISLIGFFSPLPAAHANQIETPQQFKAGATICRNAVYRIFEERIKGAQRGFSPYDITVEVNPVLKDRLATSPSAMAAVISAGTSYHWTAPSKNSSGYCDISPSGRPKVVMINPL